MIKRDKKSKEKKNEMRETETVLYGELVVLGTDGELPNGNRGRRRSRYQVFLKIIGFLKNWKKNFDPPGPSGRSPGGGLISQLIGGISKNASMMLFVFL